MVIQEGITLVILALSPLPQHGSPNTHTMQPDSPDAILHLATLHLLSQAGFASTSKAASLTLTSVTAQYFRVVAQACVDRATLAGRSKVAAQDVVGALQGLGAGYGMDELMEYGVDNAGVGFKSEGIDDLAGGWRSARFA
jgi:histone H3/H4